MPKYTPNEGKLAKHVILRANLPALQICLAKAAIVPSEALELGDITEADFSGYPAGGITVNVADMDAAAIVADKSKFVQTLFSEFEHNGGATANDIYAVYVHDGVALWDYEDIPDGPKTMAVNGDMIRYKWADTYDRE